MTVLGLDCAGKTAGVALCTDGELFYESRLCAGFTHSETLLPLCEEALRACRLSLQDISLLAVTAGPGSFTGLRIGLATVKGLAFAHGTPCAGVSTLEALAFCAPPVGSCVCALDALGGRRAQDIFLLPEHARCPGALGVCRAALQVQPQSAETLAPRYLRLSQAERERAEKLARKGL